MTEIGPDNIPRMRATLAAFVVALSLGVPAAAAPAPSSSTNGGATWSAEAKLSRYVPGYPYEYATPRDGFAEPYGDYFELDVEGAGVAHAIWGEGPSYVGPGNVWYARGH